MTEPRRLNKESVIPRLIVAPWGIPKAGKTHFALSFPEPIHLFNFDDPDLEGLILQRFPDKDIQWFDYFVTDKPAEHAALLEDFAQTYFKSLAQLKGTGGTLVVDTTSQLWQIAQSVKLEEIKTRRARKKDIDKEDVQIHQFDYSQANLWMGSILRAPMAYPGVNVVHVMKAKKQYAGGSETGQQEPQGFNETAGIVKLVVQILTDGSAIVTASRHDRTHAGWHIKHSKPVDYEYFRHLYLEEGG